MGIDPACQSLDSLIFKVLTLQIMPHSPRPAQYLHLAHCSIVLIQWSLPLNLLRLQQITQLCVPMSIWLYSAWLYWYIKLSWALLQYTTAIAHCHCPPFACIDTALLPNHCPLGHATLKLTLRSLACIDTASCPEPSIQCSSLVITCIWYSRLDLTSQHSLVLIQSQPY